MSIQPLVDIPIPALIKALPKTDLHIHQEEVARLERVVACRQGRPPHDWRESAQRLMAKTSAGKNRLLDMYAPDSHLDLSGEPADDPEYIIATMTNALEEGATNGAMLLELRFGAGGLALTRPDFMTLFREAERRIQMRYPHFCAEAIGYLRLINDPAQLLTVERQLERCLQLADKGLAGLDLITAPYDTEANPALWAIAYDWAERAADAGLGITIHAGEFSTANLAAALKTPGLQRVGHAVYAATEPSLLDQLAQSGVTVECSLSCNVVLGAVPSYEAHPIRRFVACGIPVTINTDDPVRVWTTIGREYAIAHLLGFSPNKLFEVTRHAVQVAFTSPERKKKLLIELDKWATSNLHAN